MLVNGTISIDEAGNDDAVRRLDERNKGVTFKNCVLLVLFTGCISEMNNTQIDNAKYINVVMTEYNLIEYIDKYLKTSGGLW